MNKWAPLWVCDSCTLIDLVTFDARYRESLAPVRRAREIGEIRFGISEVSVAECCKLTQDGKPPMDAKDAFALVEAYVSHEHTQRFPVTPPVAFRAAVLIRRCRLETCDAIIVGTALTHGAKKLITRDESSLCKRIRKSQTPPSVIKRSEQAELPTWDGEAAVLAELAALEIFELRPLRPPPVVSQERVPTEHAVAMEGDLTGSASAPSGASAVADVGSDGKGVGSNPCTSTHTSQQEGQ